ncbi:MAG: hypothetical protein QM736_16850 [Vicinamibacterales bacterium]
MTPFWRHRIPIRADPGRDNGTGNPQGGFTVVTDNGIEIGLRAKHRQDPNVIHTSTNVYDVQPGSQDGIVTNRAWWNYEWSIDLQPGAVGDLVLSDIFPYLDADHSGLDRRRVGDHQPPILERQLGTGVQRANRMAMPVTALARICWQPTGVSRTARTRTLATSRCSSRQGISST